MRNQGDGRADAKETRLGFSSWRWSRVTDRQRELLGSGGAFNCDDEFSVLEIVEESKKR